MVRSRVFRVLVLGLAMSAGLAASPAQAWEKGKLLIWVNNDKGYKGLQKVGDEFTRRTGIRVKVETPANPTDAFAAAMARGNGPDIWIWAHDRIGDWIRSGWLTPVEMGQKERDGIVQVALEGFTSQGKLWGYPIAVEAVSLLYNRDLVAKPPKSFEELPALDAKLKAKGVRAIGWETQSPYFTWPMFAAGGAYAFSRDRFGNYRASDTGINQAGAVRGAELLQQLIRSGVVTRDLSYNDAEKAMKERKQAMWITGPWAWEGLRKAGVRFGIASLPTVAGQPSRPFVGVLGAMLTRGSPNRAAAVDFIEHQLMAADGLKTVNADRPIGIPASKALFWDFYADSQIRQEMEGVFAGKSMPNNPEMQYFWKNLSKALIEITTTNHKPKETLDAAAKAILSKQ